MVKYTRHFKTTDTPTTRPCLFANPTIGSNPQMDPVQTRLRGGPFFGSDPGFPGRSANRSSPYPIVGFHFWFRSGVSFSATILIADFSARGVGHCPLWCDTDAPSYINRSPVNVLRAAEREMLKYGRACEDLPASFTPLCISIDGLLGSELDYLLNTWLMV